MLSLTIFAAAAAQGTATPAPRPANAGPVGQSPSATCADQHRPPPVKRSA